MMLHTKYEGSVVSDKKIFNVFNSKIYFSLCDLDMQQTGTICTINKGGLTRIIPAKLGENPASSLRGGVL